MNHLQYLGAVGNKAVFRSYFPWPRLTAIRTSPPPATNSLFHLLADPPYSTPLVNYFTPPVPHIHSPSCPLNSRVVQSRPLILQTHSRKSHILRLQLAAL